MNDARLVANFDIDYEYIINLQNKEFLSDIYKLENYEHEIDRYYRTVIHTKYKAYG